MWSKRTFRWKELALCAVALIVSVAGLELLLWVLGLSWPVLWQSDGNRGVSRPPGARWIQENEGSATILINRYGFRSKEVGLEKASGTLRVAVLGDSYTEALQVAMEERFTEVAEEKLAKRLRQPVEVLNFGMEGYGTAQEILTFRHHVQQYRPDVVLLQFFAANDVRNNSKSLEGDPARPYFQLKDNRLQLDTSYRDYNEVWWRRWGLSMSHRSRVAQLGYAALRRIRTRQKMRHADSVAGTGSAESSDLLPNAGLDEQQIYREPRDPVWLDAWMVTEALIAQFHKEATAIGSRFLVLAVPHSVEIHPNPIVRSDFARRVGAKDLSYADRRLRDLGNRLGFATLILSDELGKYSLATGHALCGFANTRLGWGHFNAEGHRIAGEFLATAIVEQEWRAWGTSAF